MIRSNIQIIPWVLVLYSTNRMKCMPLRRQVYLLYLSGDSVTSHGILCVPNRQWDRGDESLPLSFCSLYASLVTPIYTDLIVRNAPIIVSVSSRYCSSCELSVLVKFNMNLLTTVHTQYENQMLIIEMLEC